MLDAVNLPFIVPELPLGCSSAELVEQNLQVYSVWSGETHVLLYLTQAKQVFPFLVHWVSSWSVLVRGCCRLPSFESLLGCNFYEQEGKRVLKPKVILQWYKR